jgi:hypothetical protein
MKTMSRLVNLHNNLEEIFLHARAEWEKDHAAGFKRRESYWQGKKDGVRASMNLMYQQMSEEEKIERISGEEKDSTDR